MRTIDHDGLTLCNIQGEIFSSSLTSTSTSSPIFIRRYMLSKIVESFDDTSFLDASISQQDVFSAILDEYGDRSYGQSKYPKEALFWMGYLYRYMAYTYQMSSKKAYRIVKPKELLSAYPVYHSLDPQAAISRILEEKGISFDIEAENKRLLALLKKRAYQTNIKLVSIEPKQTRYEQLVKELEEYYQFIIQNNTSKEILELTYKNKRTTLALLEKKSKKESELTLVLGEEKEANEVSIEKTLAFLNKKAKGDMTVKLSRGDKDFVSTLKKAGFSYWKENEAFTYWTKSV